MEKRLNDVCGSVTVVPQIKFSEALFTGKLNTVYRFVLVIRLHPIDILSHYSQSHLFKHGFPENAEVFWHRARVELSKSV